MDAAYYRRKAQDAQKEIVKLQEEKARLSRDIADANRKVVEAQQAIARTSSASTRASKQRDVERAQQAAVTAQKRITELETKIAKAQQKQADAERDAQREEARNIEKQQREAERQQREREKRDRTVDSTLKRHEALHRTTRMEIEELRRLPERIAVLVLTANPVDQNQLRLDEEVRLITTEIRASEHRDVIKLDSRWAARPLDMLQTINEVKPTIVHFSGHGSENGELIFQDDSGRTKPVSLRAIVETMHAVEGIKLVFLNACFSAAQAQAIVEYIPVAIGMTDAIDDTAARIFAAKFYSAIGFGHSVHRAYLQARAALFLEGMPDEDMAFLVSAPDVDPDELILVRPANVPSDHSQSEDQSTNF